MFSYNLLQSVIPSKILYSNTQKILNDFTNNDTSSLYLLKKYKTKRVKAFAFTLYYALLLFVVFGFLKFQSTNF